MSGFEFHLECLSCGLKSRVFPYRGERWAPGLLKLPAANSVSGSFELVELESLDADANDMEIVQRATQVSTPERQVAVPVTTGTGMVLQPDLRCPRCGAGPVHSKLGTPDPVQAQFLSLDELVRHARSLDLAQPGRFESADGALSVDCIRNVDGEDDVYAWQINHEKGAEVGNFASALIRRLTETGGTCSVPYTGRRYVAFEERRQSHGQ